MTLRAIGSIETTLSSSAPIGTGIPPLGSSHKNHVGINTSKEDSVSLSNQITMYSPYKFGNLVFKKVSKAEVRASHGRNRANNPEMDFHLQPSRSLEGNSSTAQVKSRNLQLHLLLGYLIFTLVLKPL